MGFQKSYLKKEQIKITTIISFLKNDIETSTLTEILDNHLPQNQEIDFLSIDVEGLDFMVLKSNDFEKYKPKVILIEILQSSLSDIENNEISQYLEKYDYSIYAKAVNTVIFISNQFYYERVK